MFGDLALPKQIERKRDIARLGEPHRLIARMLVVPPPLVHDQYTRALALHAIVPRDEALQRRIALAVLQLLRLDLGARDGRDREQHEAGSQESR